MKNKKRDLGGYYRSLNGKYKEKRIYKHRPQYNAFEEFPEDLQKVFDLCIDVLGCTPVTIQLGDDWIKIKRFLINKTHPRKRSLWGFSLRHRGTSKIQLNNNDLLVIMEWEKRTGRRPMIPKEKLLDVDYQHLPWHHQSLLYHCIQRNKERLAGKQLEESIYERAIQQMKYLGVYDRVVQIYEERHGKIPKELIP